jgi:hypothetical protein
MKYLFSIITKKSVKNYDIVINFEIVIIGIVK